MSPRRLAVLAACGLLIVGGAVSASVIPGSARPGAARSVRPTAPESVQFLNARVGWVTDEYGQRLLMTSDGGKGWITVSPPALGRPRNPPRRMLAGALFRSRSNFWAAVFNEASGRVELLQTKNGGRAWIDARRFKHDDGHVWIDFLNRRRGWVMIGNGEASDQEPVTVYRTDSGGARWTEVARSSGLMWTGTRGGPSSGCDKSGMSFSTRSSGWITGFCDGAVGLDHTLDGGAHWRSVALTKARETEYGGDTLPPRFFNAQDGVIPAVIGGRDRGRSLIYTSTNAGASWSGHGFPGGASVGPVSVVSPEVWVAASTNTLYTTRDGGASWTSRRLAIGSVWGWSGTLDFVGATDGWAITGIGEGSWLWHTTTGGRHWTRIQ